MFKIHKNIKDEKVTKLPNGEWMPFPGMLGTEYVGSDRYVVVCVSVDSPKRISVAKLWDIDENNIDNHPNIEIDDEGIMWIKDMSKEKTYNTSKWSLRTNKRGNSYWKEMNTSYSSTIYWGKAEPYRDPSF